MLIKQLSPDDAFAADVLDILKRRKVTFRGCQPLYLELLGVGHIRATFAGNRNGKPWQGSVTCVAHELDDMVKMGRTDVCAQAIEESIDHCRSRFE